jgi:hypothetical protein
MQKYDGTTAPKRFVVYDGFVQQDGTHFDLDPPPARLQLPFRKEG